MSDYDSESMFMKMQGTLFEVSNYKSPTEILAELEERKFIEFDGSVIIVVSEFAIYGAGCPLKVYRTGALLTSADISRTIYYYMAISSIIMPGDGK